MSNKQQNTHECEIITVVTVIEAVFRLHQCIMTPERLFIIFIVIFF